jgi:hypothetical protein
VYRCILPHYWQDVRDNQLKFYADISCLGGVFAKNTSRETKNFPSRMTQIPLPNMTYLFNYTEYYLEHWLNKWYLLFVVFRILYNYHPCWSVTRRFVSQRKVTDNVLQILLQASRWRVIIGQIPRQWRKSWKKTKNWLKKYPFHQLIRRQHSDKRCNYKKYLMIFQPWKLIPWKLQHCPII